MPKLNEALLREALRGKRFGNPLWCEREVESTFLSLRERIREGAPEGAVLVAEAQTKGRGRLGRDWASPEGAGLYFNLLLRPKIPAKEAPRLNFAVALGVARALRALGFEALLKWPNDVLVKGKKVCGILCEAGFNDEGGLDFVSAGIGVNVKSEAVPEELREKAAALQEFSLIERETLLLALLHALEESVALCLRDFY
ncbi:MAG: biotin--[acetyl-CoA-carboxylase] ligase, partial [Christensenellaceae bacterium]|nr:biotin--[acetyl-CoA-carboxylase] ligase [Christensenellaceae bacterium]